MKKILVLFFTFLLSTNTLVFAQDNQSPKSVATLPIPQKGQVEEHLLKLSPIRWLPDNRFYFLIVWKESIQHLLKANTAKKAYFDTILTGKRIKEAYLLAQKGSLPLSLQTTIRYTKQLKRLEKELTAGQTQGADVMATLNLLSDNLFRHQDLMAQIMTSVPNEQKSKFLQELDRANENLIAIAKILEKDRPDQTKRLLSRYKLNTP